MVPHTNSEHMALTPVPQWFIAFTSYRGSNKLYRKFLPYGFGHVFAFAPLRDGVLLVDPREGGVVLAVPPLGDGLATTPFCPSVCPSVSEATLGVTSSAFIAGLKAALPDVSILSVTPLKALDKKHLSMFVPTCVTAIKSILALRSWVVTPYGLFKLLRKRYQAQLVDDRYLAMLTEKDICMRTALFKANANL